MTKKRSDRVTRALMDDTDEKSSQGLPLPSPNPATNILIADIVVRGASTMFRKGVEDRVAKAGYEDEERAAEALDGRTLMTSLALYGASKMATRSPVGLAVVAGGLALKTLYDRGKRRQSSRKRINKAKG